MFFRYVLGSLLARKISNAVAILSIGLVIGASVLAIAFYDGLRKNLAVTGRSDNVVVVQGGVLQMTKSLMTKESIDQLSVLPQIAEIDGKPAVSVESHLDIDLEDESVVPLRGVDPIAYLVHDNVKIIEGREATKGSDELVIGRRLLKQGLAVGKTLAVGDEQWPIVGVFSAEGSAFESEVWADRTRIGVMTKRTNLAAAIVRAKSEADVPSLVTAISELRLGEQKGRVWALPEREYYEATLGDLTVVTKAVAAIILILVFGAVFAAANTLHASLSGRIGEFAALWVVGNRRSRLINLVLQEAFLVCGVAAVVACLMAAPFAGAEASKLLGGELEFTLPFGLKEIGSAFLLAAGIGILGTLYPSIQLMRGKLADELG